MPKLDVKHISIAFFCAIATKLLIQNDISGFQAASLLIATLFVAFHEYKASIQQINKQQKEIDEIKKEMDGLRKVQTDVITNISSIKLAQNIKSQRTNSF